MLKGKLVLTPVDSPIKGMSVVTTFFGQRVIIEVVKVISPNVCRVFGTYNVHTVRGDYGLSDLRQIAIEYEEWRVKREYEKTELTTYTYPLHPSNWEEGLKLLGQEVEFKTEYSKSENKVYSKLITLPKQEETWEEIVHKVFNLNPLARIRLSVIRYKQLLDWLKENYLPPIKKKQWIK